MFFSQMTHCKLSFVVAFFTLVVLNVQSEIPFATNYEVVWGHDHVTYLDQGREVDLWMDINSGAGFASKLSYGTGFFHLRMKLPNRNSAGVVTAFYLASDGNEHDEVDFEFLGNLEGKPITIQSNVFVNGRGGREQRTLLWFDPSADFHTYKILWNTHQIVFFVDSIPIRVFKNVTMYGLEYPRQPMKVQASIWNGDSWATDGGRTKIDWAYAPFTAHFQGFSFGGCSTLGESCYDSKHWWNQNKYWKLSNKQQRNLEEVRAKYMNYDYCIDRARYPVLPPECTFNI